VNWFRRYVCGPHAGEWLAFTLAILVFFGLSIALVRLVFRRKRKRDTSENVDESKREYWRIHEG